MLMIIICSIVQYKTTFVYRNDQRNACLCSVISPVLEPTAFLLWVKCRLEDSDPNEFIILGSVAEEALTFKAIRACLFGNMSANLPNLLNLESDVYSSA